MLRIIKCLQNKNISQTLEFLQGFSSKVSNGGLVEIVKR